MAELDLIQEELRELATPVIEAAGNPSEPFGVYFFGPNEPAAELARSVERDVFGKWFGNSAELLAAEYDHDDRDLVFFCVLDHRRRLPAGMARVGLPSGDLCKSFVDLEQRWGASIEDLVVTMGADWEPRETWDSLTIAVADEYRGKATDGLISLAILQTGAQGLRRCGFRTTVTILDVNVLGMVQPMLQDPYQLFPGVEPMSYLDSPASLPVFLDLDEWEPRLRDADPVMYELMIEGRGIEPAVRAPSWAPLMRAVGLEPRPASVTH